MPGSSILKDLQVVSRDLLRRPLLAVLAVFCLGPAVGTSSTMLAVLDTLLWRPPGEVIDPESLKRLYVRESEPGFGESLMSEFSYPAYQDLKTVRSFSGVGLYLPLAASVGSGEEARQVRAEAVSAGLLPLLGVRPLIGRLFTSSGSDESGESALLLGYREWQRFFGGKADVLGRGVSVDGKDYVVIGVLPEGFRGLELEGADLWLPLGPSAAGLVGQNWRSSRGTLTFQVVARLRGGVEAETAAGEATAVLRGSADSREGPGASARVVVSPLQRGRGPEISPEDRVVRWLGGLSLLVLLIACANVGNLLFVRALERRRSLVVRVALGASRWHLWRLLLSEAAVLSALAGATAVLVMRGEVAVLQDRLVLECAPAVGVEGRSLAALAVVSAVACLLCATIPAAWASRLKISEALREGGGATRPWARLQAVLCMGQIGLTLVLLANAGQFAISLKSVVTQDLGMDTDRVLLLSAGLSRAGYSKERAQQVLSLGGERVKTLAGVERVGLAALVPFESAMMRRIQVPGLDPLPKLPMGGPYVNEISEDYFATVGTPVLRGRGFTTWDRKDTAPVVVVNQTMARLLWPGRSALGECLRIGRGRVPCSTVVGIVKNARQFGLEARPTMQYYVPLGQGESGAGVLLVRVRGRAEPIKERIRREVQGIAPGLPYVSARSLAEVIAPQIRPFKAGMRVLSFFGILALVLSLAGLYGLIANWVAGHRRELGVRVVLGARWRELVRLILFEAMRVGLGGVLLGFLLTVALARFVEPLLFEAEAWQPWVLYGTASLLGGLVVVAGLLSGLRVLRIDPGVVLNAE